MIVIDGPQKEANRYALLASLYENDLNYKLFDAGEMEVEEIIDSIKMVRTKRRAMLVKNVSRETDLTALLMYCAGRISLIVTCDLNLVAVNIKTPFQLITIKQF